MKKLENKTVFITGGLSGIGKACAVLAAKEGANVAIADIQSNTTELAMQEIKAVNSKAIFIPCDVSDFAQVGNAIKKQLTHFLLLM
jgi:NAD(P)-dependent dehydrogenase (short-subunit alcohol dehydrogenase family)